MRHRIGLGQKITRVTINFRKDDQGNCEISGCVQNHGEKRQHCCWNAKKCAADSRTKNFVSGQPRQRNTKCQSRRQQPSEQKSDACNPQRHRPTVAQEALYWLSQGVRHAKIATHCAFQIIRVVAQYILFTRPRLSKSVDALRAEAGIKLMFVCVKPGASRTSVAESKPPSSAM